jgi:hypothetical protein
MADRTEERTHVRAEDVLQVGTRVSWGAILAGATVAMAVHIVLSLLGAAFGFSFMDPHNADSQWRFLYGALYSLFACAVSFFIGGWVATQMAVGENRTEAIIHGAATWAVTAGLLLWLASVGVQAGLAAMVGMNYAADRANDRPADTRNFDSWAKRAFPDMTDEQIREAKERLDKGLSDPKNREDTRRTAATVAWWAVAGTLLSMVAAVMGALVGAGPEFRLWMSSGGSMFVGVGHPRRADERVSV